MKLALDRQKMKTHCPAGILALVLCVATFALADTKPKTLRPRPVVDSNKPGQLQLIIGAGASPTYLEEWVSEPSTQPIGIPRLKTCRPHQTVYFGFFVTGYTIDTNGIMDCTAEIRVIHPDGTEVFDTPAYSASKGRQLSTGFVALDPAMDLILEAGDPPGTYRIEGTVTDKVSGTSAKAVYTIEFTK